MLYIRGAYRTRTDHLNTASVEIKVENQSVTLVGVHKRGLY